MKTQPWTFCVAPMMDWTDRHYRRLFRLISRHARLYTEMVTAAALIRGDKHRFLAYDPSESPLALQLGGSDPQELGLCARMGEDFGYNEINLNVGCPSDRVKSGRFGACLMAEPERVADCIGHMQSKVSIPVTVKCRIGIDDLDTQEHFFHFIKTVSQSGCETFIVHARKAWLNGLSPKENREIPPLQVERVLALKQALPHLTIILNGGILNTDACEQALANFDGVMIGRAAYHDPMRFADVDQRLFHESSSPMTGYEVLDAYIPYIESQLQQGVPLKSITRHILSLFTHQTGARAWRRMLSQYAHKPGAGVQLVKEAMKHVWVSSTSPPSGVAYEPPS